ncbi:hypothetical protein KI387_031952, partial [Taxus chinensis]
VRNQNVTRLCRMHQIVTVNRQFPGPTLYAHDGDNVVIRVRNRSPYNLTVHWHGIRQLRSCWADGPAYFTQCPILPGKAYTYNFTIIKQEGTLFWHAHISYLRATVHGALVVFPSLGKHYPFPKPAEEFPIILGEWWNANVEDVIADAIRRGAVPNESDAYTINSQPGDFYQCSANDTTRILVEKGKHYLLRIVNAAMNHGFFFKIARHNVTVVAMDAVYTKPYKTDVVVIQPGNTMDLLFKARRSSGRSYYIATRVYNSQPQGERFIKTTTTAILQYTGGNATSSSPVLPDLPAFNDTAGAFKFSTDQKSLRRSIPQGFDEEMFITEGFSLISCPSNSCAGINGGRAVGSFSNITFVLPVIDILQAYYFGINGVFTRDFPDNPPLAFNYTGTVPLSLWEPEQATKVKVFKFNTTVQIVFQNTAIITVENHPIHLHGHDFYVVGQGFGNYNPQTDPATFNLVDPQMLNTVGVPTGGWTAIRFITNNP